MNRIKLDGARVGIALCGSFCTFARAFAAAQELKALGAELLPIMSFNAASISTRFGAAEENRRQLAEICGSEVITTIEGAEPIGPKKLLDVLLLPNCTGNTLAKLAGSITDTPVTMAVKSHLRAQRPVLLNVATNDALAGSAKNIGLLLNTRHFFFVPMREDDCMSKPASVVGDFTRIPECVSLAMQGVQAQPIIC